MRNSSVVCGLMLVGLALGVWALAAGPADSDQSAPKQPSAPATFLEAAPAAPLSADEAKIRKNVVAFLEAYNSSDAKAIANLFAADGEIVAEDGETQTGRAAIEEQFAGLFKQFPKTHMTAEVKSIRLVGPTVAIEEGSATTLHDTLMAAEHSRYEVIHVKQDGKWLMASARDLPDETASGEEELKQLEWLIGDWVDESPEALVVTNYHWTEGHHFIVGDFTTRVEGRPTMSGSQRIAWDPLTKKIHSWVFDTEGGFGEATWTRDENRWIIKASGVTNDGRAASATRILTRLHKHQMTWESRDREVDGEHQPNLGPFTIVRKPPAPQGTKPAGG